MQPHEHDFSPFFEKVLVSRPNRRMCNRIVRFWNAEIENTFGISLPLSVVLRYVAPARMVRSVGRASRLHRECRGVDPLTSHHFLLIVPKTHIQRPTNTNVGKRQSLGVRACQSQTSDQKWDLRIHPIVTRLVEKDVLEKMGATPVSQER